MSETIDCRLCFVICEDPEGAVFRPGVLKVISVLKNGGTRRSKSFTYLLEIKLDRKWIKEAARWRLMGLCRVLIECNIKGSGLAEGDLYFFLGLCLVSIFAEGDIVLTGHRNF